ncbi:MAG: right-handed parallel beta-helix repeat-containing protein [Planctomycetaceae bacterium]|nr:right-handed parallel beta-helix repeat-containing protein [Planctomycetaceae bacterium]
MKIWQWICGLSFVGCAAICSADDVSKSESLTLPPGYANHRTATDPNQPQPAAKSGELKSYATLHSLGFEWDLGGSDTNHNATCRVAYRRSDKTAWHDALPLFRVDYAGWYADRTARAKYNMFAGSIMFLRPGAEYVVRLSLVDPDGGDTEREVKLATHPIPDYGTPTRTWHVVPRTADDNSQPGDGSEIKPFRGIIEAQRAAQPGDLMLLHAGKYINPTFDRSGTVAAEGVNGAQAKYIVWKAAGDGPAVFDRCYITGSALWFEGLTFERADDRMGLRGGGDSSQVVVRANTFRNFGYAIFLDRQVRGWYIADNDISGDEKGGISGEGVELNHSSHHTVCYNRMTKTADGVSYCDTNCDIFANDVFDVSDDGVEPDYGYANNRIWGNRLDGPAGITFQAMFCGPWYIVRNQIIASTNIFKLRVQDRYLVANNTLIGYTAAAGAKLPHAHGLLTAMTRNNLWIHGGGSPYLFAVQVPKAEDQKAYMRKNVLFSTLRADWRTDVDYDGFDWSSASRGKQGHPTPFNWNGLRLDDLSMLSAAVGIEQHGRVVDKEQIFARYAPPPYPSNERPTFVLRREGAAVDAGVALPNVAEEFRGTAPDLGAFEADEPVPHVGPRSGGDWRQQHRDWILRHQRAD